MIVTKHLLMGLAVSAGLWLSACGGSGGATSSAIEKSISSRIGDFVDIDNVELSVVETNTAERAFSVDEQSDESTGDPFEHIKIIEFTAEAKVLEKTTLSPCSGDPYARTANFICATLSASAANSTLETGTVIKFENLDYVIIKTPSGTTRSIMVDGFADDWLAD